MTADHAMPTDAALDAAARRIFGDVEPTEQQLNATAAVVRAYLDALDPADIRVALNDPSRYVERADYAREHFADWQWRAVLAAVRPVVPADGDTP